MAQNAAAAAGVLRLSIVSEDRRLDVGVPAHVPLVELIPGFARSIGVLDPTLAHTGYQLRRADGTLLTASIPTLSLDVDEEEAAAVFD